MIISYAELKKKPRILKGFAGVTAAEFEELETKAEPLWQDQEFKRLEMTLVWLRLYLGLEALGYLFGVDKSTVSRYTNSVLPVLRQVGKATLGWPEPVKRDQGKRLEQVWQEQPDLLAYVDATEQRIRRSSNDEQQKKDFSGKKNQPPAKPSSSSMRRDYPGSEPVQPWLQARPKAF